jgi:hypothetical protein
LHKKVKMAVQKRKWGRSPLGAFDAYLRGNLSPSKKDWWYTDGLLKNGEQGQGEDKEKDAHCNWCRDRHDEVRGVRQGGVEIFII